MAAVKRPRRPGYTRVSRKHQVTLPVEALGAAGVRPGDVVKVEVHGDGRIVLIRQRNPLEAHAASLTGVYRANEVDDLRNEWR